MRPPLIVFDWDGTLVDSGAAIAAAMNQALAEEGLPTVPPERVQAHIGLSLDEVIHGICDQPLGEAALASLRATYRRAFFALPPGSMPLFPGVREALDALRAGGARLAIASGKSRRGLEQAADDLGVAALFSRIAGADEVPRGKPAPDLLEAILAGEGVAPASAWMVGDTTYDMGMARAAGVPALGVTWGLHPAADLVAAGADALVDRPDQWVTKLLPD